MSNIIRKTARLTALAAYASFAITFLAGNFQATPAPFEAFVTTPLVLLAASVLWACVDHLITARRSTPAPVTRAARGAGRKTPREDAWPVGASVSQI